MPVTRDFPRELLLAEGKIAAHLPIGKEIRYKSIISGKTLVFKRGRLLGVGGSGIVKIFRGNDSSQYAAKLFIFEGGVDRTEQLANAHLRILESPPEGDPKAVCQVQLALPLFVVEKEDAGPIIVLAYFFVFNSILLSPLFPTDLRKLVRFLHEEPNRGLSAFLSITQQALRAVRDLHSRGLAHLDIKPDNFLVSKEGDVFLGDFDGIKSLGSPLLPVMFTPEFLSPEMARTIALSLQTFTNP